MEISQNLINPIDENGLVSVAGSLTGFSTTFVILTMSEQVYFGHWHTVQAVKPYLKTPHGSS